MPRSQTQQSLPKWSLWTASGTPFECACENIPERASQNGSCGCPKNSLGAHGTTNQKSLPERTAPQESQMPQSLTQRNSTRLSGGGGILSTRFKDKMREGKHHSDLRQPNRPLLSRNLPGCARRVLDTYMLYVIYIYIYIYIYQIFVYLVRYMSIWSIWSRYIHPVALIRTSQDPQERSPRQDLLGKVS
jgi:hypothetical protein